MIAEGETASIEIQPDGLGTMPSTMAGMNLALKI